MKNSGTTGGVSFVGLLTIVFIVLKLCNVITWSWLWVLSPIWISVSIAIVVGIILALLTMRKQDRDNNDQMKLLFEIY